jgi:hypothetical protein
LRVKENLKCGVGFAAAFAEEERLEGGIGSVAGVAGEDAEVNIERMAEKGDGEVAEEAAGKVVEETDEEAVEVAHSQNLDKLHRVRQRFADDFAVDILLAG